MAPPLSSAHRGAHWLIGLQQPDGSFKGARSVEDYYKAPFGLILTGHVAEAERLLDHVGKKYLREDGDLDGNGVAWFDQFRIYPHSWLTIAAMMLGRFEIAHSLLRVLVAHHDESSGGFFSTPEGRRQGRGVQDVMTTSIAGLACLWAGRLDIALRTGQWIQRLYEAQPDLSQGLYFVWDSQAGLVTHFPETEATAFCVDVNKTTQWYFEYGIAAAFLASLCGVTRDRRWLELAQKFLRASKVCRDDVYRQPQSGKIGWGAAWTYRLSGDPEDRQLVKAVAAGLHALQSPEGWWSALNVYDYKKAMNVESSIDVTNEFVGLLGCMELVLR
jgi:hypothetical protein